MSNNWNKLDPENHKGPIAWFFQILIVCVIVSLMSGTAAYFLGWIGEGAHVAQKQFGPQATLDKYIWWKQAAAGLKAKQENILSMRKGLGDLRAQYKGKERKDWARTDLESESLKQTELQAAIGSYNDLAGQYNAAMAEFNMAFANRGTLPSGAQDVLPDGFALYNSDGSPIAP